MMTTLKIRSLTVTLIILFNMIMVGVPPLKNNSVNAAAPPNNENQINYGTDWNITDYTYRGNQTIILTGNLTIESGGVLVFRNVTLKMAAPYNGSYYIKVNNSGEFYVYNGSVITNNGTNGSYRYLFWVEPLRV